MRQLMFIIADVTSVQVYLTDGAKFQRTNAV